MSVCLQKSSWKYFFHIYMIGRGPLTFIAVEKIKVHLFFVENKRDMVSSVPWCVHHFQGGSIRAK